MQYTEAVVQRIDARIAELRTEIESLESALAALKGRESTDGAANSNGRRTRTRASRASAATPRPRRPRTTSADAVFDALNDGNDQASEIAKQFGVSPAVVRNRLLQLEEAGRVSRTGNRRSTRWRSHAG